MTKFITNQNIEIKLELAGLGDRILAFFIDAFIMGAYALTAAAFSSLMRESFPYFFFMLLLPLLFYSLLFEVFSNGHTPGKKVRNIKVVKLDGGAPGLFNYLLRWIIKPIDVLIYGSIAVLCIIITKNGQRLGDLAAGTTVIREKPTVKLSDVQSFAKDKGHVIVYPQVKRLNDKQAELIRRALQMRRDGFNDDAVQEVAEKTKNFLQLETTLSPLDFLYTILKDYEHLHQD